MPRAVNTNFRPDSPFVKLESLLIEDPREWGELDITDFPLTQLACGLPWFPSIEQMRVLEQSIFRRLSSGAEQELRNSLNACVDEQGYKLLYGLIAQGASDTSALAVPDNVDVPWAECIFAIPLTLHRTGDPSPERWSPKNMERRLPQESLQELRALLDKYGITKGMEELVVLPHLVDFAPLESMAFCDVAKLRTQLLEHPEDAARNPLLAHRAWLPTTNEAQSRVLLLASRGRLSPSGLDVGHDICARALNKWAAECFGTPPGYLAVAGSPERMVSALTGKGRHMRNCAHLVHTRALAYEAYEASEREGVSPFLTVNARSLPGCKAILQFSQFGLSSDWHLHGRTNYESDIRSLEAFLKGNLFRYARARLGLERE